MTRCSPAAVARSRSVPRTLPANPLPWRSVRTAAAMTQSVSAGTEFSCPVTALIIAPS